jgi:transcription elongation factor/antiterminator RfaH
MNLPRVNMPRNWYVLYTMPNFERKVTCQLENQSIHAYLPVIKVEKAWSDRMKVVERPLFPNYVFVRTERSNLWQALAEKGVIRVLSNGKDPSAINDSVIDTIKKVTTNAYDVRNESTFAQGDLVTINNGPLKGISGRIVDLKGMMRLLITLRVLNQVISISVMSNQLTKITSIDNHD